MAYMCADSGNLMAIAQQVIQQKQQQQRQQQQQQQQLSSATAAAPPWGAITEHHFPFVLPDPVFPDAFSAADHGSPPADGGVPFRLSDFVSSVSAGTEFESDEWMESLIGDSPPDGDLLSDAWKTGGGGGAGGGGKTSLPPLFSEPAAFVSSAAMTLPTAASPDINAVILAESRQIKLCDRPSPPHEPKDEAAISKDNVVPVTAAAAASPPLLKSLLDCVRVADSHPDLAAKTLTRVKEFASDTGDPTQRVAFYFAEALSHCLSSASPPPVRTVSAAELTLCYKALNDACPYSKFAHLTANQAILEATESASKIHIVDFGIVHGVQWAALLQALATRSSGKPDRVRISGVPSSTLGGSPTASLSATGSRLRDFADLLDLDFEFVPVLDPIGELTESAFKVEHGEAVAVNFMLQLHHLLDESDDAVERAVKLAKALAPRVVTLGEHEASVNRGAYSERFGSALSYYAVAFESIDAAMERGSAERAAAERSLLGHRILGAVGTEGERRVRTEGRDAWRALMARCGMEPVKISHYAVSQARILLWSYDYSSRYGLVESPPGFLSLAWEDRPLLTVSSWR